MLTAVTETLRHTSGISNNSSGSIRMSQNSSQPQMNESCKYNTNYLISSTYMHANPLDSTTLESERKPSEILVSSKMR